MSSKKAPLPVNKPSAPSAILLCTRKNDALVEFALGDLNNQAFVSRYAVELPRKEEMERFIAQISQEGGA